MTWLVRARNALEQVLFLAPFIRLIAAAVQDDDVEDVAPQSEYRRDEHDFTVDIAWIQESFDRLGQQPDQETPND